MGTTRAAPDVAVAIGLSADGYKTRSALLAKLPSNLAAPVFVVQHRSARYPSLLTRILSRHASLAVKTAQDGDPVEAGVVYVAPPDRHMRLAGDRITLDASPKVAFSRPSIDVLFQSLAEAYGPRCIAVLLSGSGADGAAGLEAIREAGGTTLVQDPEEARFPQMIRAALVRAAHTVVRRDQVPTLVAEFVASGRGGHRPTLGDPRAAGPAAPGTAVAARPHDAQPR